MQRDQPLPEGARPRDVARLGQRCGGLEKDFRLVGIEIACGLGLGEGGFRIAEIAQRGGEQGSCLGVLWRHRGRLPKGRARRFPIAVGRIGPCPKHEAAGIHGRDLVGLVEGRKREIGPVVGQPLRGRIAEDHGAQVGAHRAVRILGHAREQGCRGAMGAKGGKRVGLAQARRHAAAASEPDRGILAGLVRVGGDGGPAFVRRADLGRGRKRDKGKDEEKAAHETGLGTGGAGPMPTLLTLGHGYSADALAARLGPAWRITGTTRSAEKAAGMRARGIAAIDWADAAEVDAAIAGADAILVSLAPLPDREPTLARHAAALGRAPATWVGYLSTTVVYGDRQGGWVDETDPLAPIAERGRLRVAAEKGWIATGLPVHLFRLAGIYGPGRSAFDKLRAGTARRIVKPGQVFSRIHVADIAAVLAASIARPDPGRAYNVADDLPAPPEDVIALAAEMLGLPVPPAIPFEEADLGALARSFYSETKRVSNQRIRTELGVDLAFPTYREGLRAILRAGG